MAVPVELPKLSVAIEALETLLVERNIISPSDLSRRMEKLLREHYERGELIPPEGD